MKIIATVIATVIATIATIATVPVTNLKTCVLRIVRCCFFTTESLAY